MEVYEYSFYYFFKLLCLEFFMLERNKKGNIYVTQMINL